MKNLQLIAAIAALASGAPSFSATPDVNGRRIAVSTGGLDLTTTRGMKILDLRILHAASALCETPSHSDALGWKKFDSCRDAVRATAVRQRQAAIDAANSRRDRAFASAR